MKSTISNSDQSAEDSAVASIECGVVMPISATSSHDSSHWTQVQVLIHRAIKAAGMIPKNVWSDTAVDRITPRILNNLFAVPIAVCDITDLNPNVMLELGMRLTSKKPTIIVAEKGSVIPFDIKDFEAVIYPAGLNIIDMEIFLDQLTDYLKQRHQSFVSGAYQPFLKDVDFEFLEPKGKAVPFEQLMETRLDRIMERLDYIDMKQRAFPTTDTIRTPTFKRGTDGICVELSNINNNIGEVESILLERTGFVSSIINSRTLIIPLPIENAKRSLSKVRHALVDAKIDAEVYCYTKSISDSD